MNSYMWNPAITTRHSFATADRRRPLAFTLLEEVQADYQAADEPLLEALYAGLATTANIFKITRRQRFVDLDRRLADEVVARFDSTSTVYMHDVGSSSGITSVELYDAVRAQVPARLHASDYFDALQLVTPPGSRWTAVYDPDGRCVQLVRPPLAVLPNGQNGRRYPVNQLAAWWGRRGPLNAANKLRAAGGPGVRTVTLFHPECVRRAKEDPAFTFGRHDLFTPHIARTYHVVRAMNILNRCYFSEARLRDGVAACGRSLDAGGLFVAGRSVDEEDGRCTATVFARQGDRLIPLWDTNEGSEIRSLVTAVRL